MKRIFCLILALMLVLSLAACSESEKRNDPFGDSKPAATTESVRETQTAAATKAPETAVPETEAPETTASTEAPETTASTEVPVTSEEPETEPTTATTLPSDERPTEPNAVSSIRGTFVEDDVYTNETLNLRVACPEGWIAYTDEQIALANNMSYEMFKDTDVGSLVKQAGQFMDMMMGEYTGSNLNLIIQPSNPLLVNYSDEQLFSLSAEMYKAQFKAAGMEIVTYEPVTKQVGGEDRTVLHIVLSISGVTADEYQIWLRNSSEYMGILTISLLGGTDPQPILDGVSTLN